MTYGVSGPAPYNSDFNEWFEARRSTKNKRQFNQDYKGMRVDYDKRTLISSLGNTYSMPKQDHDAFMQKFRENRSVLSDEYIQGSQRLKNAQTPADYIDYAFDTKRQEKNLRTVECKGGHIKTITYAALYSLLKVSFTKRGDEVVFFNLPNNVAMLLMKLGEDGTFAPPGKNGEERHAVGVEFWNLVRVRESVHETRYPFEYTIDNRTHSVQIGMYKKLQNGSSDKVPTIPMVNALGVRTANEKVNDTKKKLAKEKTASKGTKMVEFETAQKTWTSSDLYDYFEPKGDNHAVYEQHQRNVANDYNLRTALETATKLYNNGAEPGLVLKAMQKLNFNLPAHNREYDGEDD